MTAPGAPTVPPSPAPFTPSGFVGLGTSRLVTAISAGPDAPERSATILAIGRSRFEQVRRHRLARGNDGGDRLDRRAARAKHRARGERTDAFRHAIGVAHHDARGLERHAETLGDDLREHRLVALTLRLAADRHLDDAVRQHAHLGELLRRAAGALDVGPDADAAELAALLRFGAPCREAGDVGELDRLVEPRDVIAGVVRGTGR